MDRDYSPGTLSLISRSGTTALPGGTLAWSFQMWDPIGALANYSAVLFLPGAGIQKTYLAKYEYDIKTAVVRVGAQEQRIWKWALLDMESVEDSLVSVAYYDAGTGKTSYESLEQQVTTELHREYDLGTERILSEWSETKSCDSGAAKLPFPVPYDIRTEKAWDWGGLWGDYRGLTISEYTYEEMDVGVADTVRSEDGSPLRHLRMENEWFVRLPGTQITLPVRREKITQIDEVFDRTTGRVVSRTERSTDDEGRRDMLARGLYSDIYNSEEERKIALAWLRSLPQRAAVEVQQMPGESSISEEVSILSQPGRRFHQYTDLERDLLRYIESNAPEGTCPFLLSDHSCGVFSGFQEPVVSSSASADMEGWSGGGCETTDGSLPSYVSNRGASQEAESSVACDHFDYDAQKMEEGYQSCPKYRALRHLIGFSGGAVAPVPVVGLAGEGQIYFEKELYFDEFLSEDTARKCAQKMAQNILKAKRSSRGIVETVEMPINTRISPNGSILSVLHDFEGLRTHVTYLPKGGVKPPEHLMLLSAGGVALNLYDRESIGKARSGIGKVIDLRPDRALVVLGGRPVSCTYSMAMRVGDTVLVFLPPGTTTSGVVQAVMG